MKATFTVKDKYLVECHWSSLGQERYVVDGKQVLKLWSFSLKGNRKFLVGNADDRHEVEIRIDTAPSAKSLLSPGDWIAQAYVDGELFVPDLTPKTRKTVKTADKVINVLVLIALALLACTVLWAILR